MVPGEAMIHAKTLVMWIMVLLGGWISSGYTQMFKTQETALAEIFVDADTVVRKSFFPTDDQLKEIRRLSQSASVPSIISYYEGIRADSTYKYAFFLDKIVRTKKAIVVVVVTPHQRIEKMEVLAFYEPADYLPIPRWFELFRGKSLSEQLWPGKGIHAVTGATLSVRAFTELARLALAIQTTIVKEK
ncbi:MAG: FMN-binding protein [Calditrichaeota bacterium]|nr:MAG: FMN-binding protein [Calditrichota bacterium]